MSPFPRYLKHALLGIAAAVTVACGSAARTPASRSFAYAPYSGGILRLVMDDPYDALDPQAGYGVTDAELFRCCLLRTLYSYRPGDTDRTHLLPDLAAGAPQVSPNRLTWTFRLRSGVRYAPPFQHYDVTSGDVERALLRLGNRHATSTSFEAYFESIAGFRAYVNGARTSISGLETPNPHTLIVKLTQPTSDLAYRFSLPATAPIPPSRTTPTAPFGAATGHDFEWGYFLVSTGPYMYAGANKVHYGKPPNLQTAAGGFEPGQSIELVRNPSWSEARDPLRRPLPSRIDIKLIAGVSAGAPPVPNPDTLLEHGQADFGMGITPDQSTATDASLRAFTSADNTLTYLTMNLARPPFDDIHVRRAVADVLNGAPPGMFPLPGHIVPPVLEQDLLQAPGPGTVSDARAEMRRSRYDPKRDGKCDVSTCRITAVSGLPPGQTAVVIRLLRRIGIRVSPTGTWDPVGPPAQDGALWMGAGWGADYPSPSDFFVVTLAGQAIVSNPTQARGVFNFNASLLGAAPDSLRAWGYKVLRVPSIDPRINQCLALVGQTAIDCWAYLDKYVNTRIIPWVPLAFGQVTEVGARRLAGVPIDPFTARPAVEQMRGEPDARAPPGMAHPPLKCVPSPVPLGSYVKTIRRGDVAPSDSFSEGTWSWNVGPPDSNCVYRSTFFEARNGIVSFEDIHPFTVPERGVIELHGSGEVAARYRITRRGKAVRATDITPDPGGRQVIMTTNPWIRG